MLRKIMIFLFSLMWWTTLIVFWMLNQLCIPEINLICSCCIIPFIYFWIWFANILRRMFISMFMKNIGMWFCFCCFVCGRLCRINWKCSFIFWVWVYLYYFFLRCLIEFTSEDIWDWVCSLLGNIKLWVQFVY